MEFLTAARLQAKKCKFGDLTDELLRDRLIVGITNDDVREKLLADPAIDLEKTIHMCKASEQATQQLKEITAKDAEAKLLDALATKTKKKWPSKGKARTEEPQQRQCQYCGGTHRRKECPAYGKKCITCNKMGHFAAVCRSRKQKEVHTVEHDDTEEEMFVSEVKNMNSYNEDWHEDITFAGGKTVKMKLDTGAQCNVLPASVANSLNLETRQSSVKRIVSYTQHKLDVKGECIAPCEL